MLSRLELQPLPSGKATFSGFRECYPLTNLNFCEGNLVQVNYIKDGQANGVE